MVLIELLMFRCVFFQIITRSINKFVTKEIHTDELINNSSRIDCILGFMFVNSSVGYMYYRVKDILTKLYNYHQYYH